MNLTKLDDFNFVDLTALVSVQFQQSGIADVHFSSGGSLAIPAEAATALRSALQHSAEARHVEDNGGDEKFTLISRKKAWFMLAENGIPYIVAAVNAKGSCSIRTFDGYTGAFLGKQYRAGDFEQSFPKLRNGRELTVPHQPNLERDCRERLPEALFKHLQQQFG